MSEPRLVTVIKRLAELEASDGLTESGLRELNALRTELQEGWPEVSKSLITAYLGGAGGYAPN